MYSSLPLSSDMYTENGYFEPYIMTAALFSPRVTSSTVCVPRDLALTEMISVPSFFTTISD